MTIRVVVADDQEVVQAGFAAPSTPSPTSPSSEPAPTRGNGQDLPPRASGCRPDGRPHARDGRYRGNPGSHGERPRRSTRADPDHVRPRRVRIRRPERRGERVPAQRRAAEHLFDAVRSSPRAMPCFAGNHAALIGEFARLRPAPRPTRPAGHLDTTRDGGPPPRRGRTLQRRDRRTPRRRRRDREDARQPRVGQARTARPRPGRRRRLRIRPRPPPLVGGDVPRWHEPRQRSLCGRSIGAQETGG